MASIGHGISDAVRNHIAVWVDDSIVDALYEEYNKAGGILKKDGTSGFRYRIRQAGSWVRKSRSNNYPTGFERLYHCKTVQKATLTVVSPASDDSATAYLFHIDGKPIAGGRTKLKSTHVSKVISAKDKTGTKASDTVYVKFTEEELRKMSMQMKLGGGLEYYELERDV